MSGGSANYGFVLDQVLAAGMRGKRVLDFGCGAGAVVRAGRAAGVDMLGADIFQVGDETRQGHVMSGELGKTIFEVADGRLPLDDASVDMVCANTVFEHVEDMDAALAEIDRVLKPGGLFLNIFPTVGVLREGHCGVPFAHWLQRHPKVQEAYLRAMRTLGLGHLKDGRSAAEWAANFADYLQRFTFYRSLAEVRRAHLARFATLQRREGEYARFRLEKAFRPAAALASAPVISHMIREAIARLAFVVLVARKAA